MYICKKLKKGIIDSGKEFLIYVCLFCSCSSCFTFSLFEQLGLRREGELFHSIGLGIFNVASKNLSLSLLVSFYGQIVDWLVFDAIFD